MGEKEKEERRREVGQRSRLRRKGISAARKEEGGASEEGIYHGAKCNG